MEAKVNRTGKRQISINIIANIISYSANVLIAFFLTPFLIEKIGKETYSFYPIANTIVSYMSILTNSLNSISSRFVTVELVKGDDNEADKYFSSTLAANLVMSCVLAVPMIFIIIFLDKIMHVPINSVAAVKLLFSLVFGAAILNIAASVFGIATFAKNRIDLRSLREIITAIIKVVLYIVLYRFFSPTIVFVGVVALVVAFVNVLFQVGYTRYLLPNIQISKAYISKEHTRTLLSSSSWNAINSFGNTLLAGMTLVMINVLYGASESGTYSIVNTIPQFMSGVIAMLVGVFLPVMTYKYAENDNHGLIDTILSSEKIIGSIGCAFALTFVLFSKYFFKLWTPNEDIKLLVITNAFAILPYFAIACLWPLTNLCIVLNKVKYPAIANLVLGVVNIILDFISCHVFKLGFLSLPLISAILQFLWVGIFIPLYISKCLKIRSITVVTPFLKSVIITAILFLLTRRIVDLFVVDNWTQFIIKGGLIGIIVLVIYTIILFGPKKVFEQIHFRKRKSHESN